MAGLVPAIHGLLSWYIETSKTWMPRTSPGMTELFERLAPRTPTLSRANSLQEVRDLGLQPPSLDGQRFRGAEHLRGSRAGLLRAGTDVADIARDLGRALGGVLRVAGDLLRGNALL